MVKKKRKYTSEFKLEAVRLATESEKTPTQVARDLGIAPSVLHGWKKQYDSRDPETVFPGHGKRAGPEAELWRLKREWEEVKQERDFLRRAAAYFARESR